MGVTADLTSCGSPAVLSPHLDRLAHTSEPGSYVLTPPSLLVPDLGRVSTAGGTVVTLPGGTPPGWVLGPKGFRTRSISSHLQLNVTYINFYTGCCQSQLKLANTSALNCVYELHFSHD